MLYYAILCYTNYYARMVSELPRFTNLEINGNALSDIGVDAIKGGDDDDENHDDDDNDYDYDDDNHDDDNHDDDNHDDDNDDDDGDGEVI